MKQPLEKEMDYFVAYYHCLDLWTVITSEEWHSL